MDRTTKITLSICMVCLFAIAIGTTFIFAWAFGTKSVEAETNINEPVEIHIEVEKKVEEPEPVEEVVHTFYEGLCEAENDRYLLAKMVMAEAEGESVENKQYVASVILNRVMYDHWPNTIEGVLYQKTGKCYQFSPIGNGRFKRVEPSQECYDAVDFVLGLEEDLSQGATFFEACSNPDNWHSRNLEFLFEVDGTRFYKIP